MENVLLTLFEAMSDNAFLKGFICGGALISVIMYFAYSRERNFYENKLEKYENRLEKQRDYYENKLEKQKQEYEREITKLTINNSARFYKA
ncbi:MULTISPECIES: hypothetical protein [Helicobacter]|uniref:hypothetical protein n=1 Tax=Helicobacter TaxID=209 RepID=UPI00260A58D8|nr:hypothetical protein [Helicobacter sp. UBA3407]